MKVLIVGGGIAGIAAASALQHYAQWEVTLIDKAPAWTNIGFSLALLPGGVRVLDHLGLGPAFRKNSLPILTTNILDGNGDTIVRIPFTPLQKYGLTATIERPVLHSLLTGSLQNVDIRMGTRVEQVEEEYDLVIAADGMRSPLRTMLLPKETLKRYYWHLWVFWLPPATPLPPGISLSLSTKGAAYLFPTHNGRTAVGITRKSAANTTYAEHVDKKELLRHVGDMGPWIKGIFDMLPEKFECYQDDLRYMQMKNWNVGRTVFIGDAQHGVSLISGIGASLALEDAWALAQELKEVMSTEDIQPALERFSARRTKALASAMHWIRYAERLAMTTSPVLAFVRNTLIKLFPSRVPAPLEAYLKKSL